MAAVSPAGLDLGRREAWSLNRFCANPVLDRARWSPLAIPRRGPRLRASADGEFTKAGRSNEGSVRCFLK